MSSDDWPQIKARHYEVEGDDSDGSFAPPSVCATCLKPWPCDFRAALQRADDLEDQVDYWMGKELALRQRVEELEREISRQEGYTESWMEQANSAKFKLARCVEALGEIRGRSLAAKTHEIGPLAAKWRLTRILELACAALAAAKGE